MRINSNLILIGMPGSGKSTLGREVAMALQRPFVDSDDLIERSQGMKLQQIIDHHGVKRFHQIEERVLLDVALRDHIIATGGSAPYSDIAARAIKPGCILHLGTRTLTSMLGAKTRPEEGRP